MWVIKVTWVLVWMCVELPRDGSQDSIVSGHTVYQAILIIIIHTEQHVQRIPGQMEIESLIDSSPVGRQQPPSPLMSILCTNKSSNRLTSSGHSIYNPLLSNLLKSIKLQADDWHNIIWSVCYNYSRKEIKAEQRGTVIITQMWSHTERAEFSQCLMSKKPKECHMLSKCTYINFCIWLVAL